MSIRGASSGLHKTESFYTLYLTGGVDVPIAGSSDIRKQADLRVAGGGLIKKNFKVGQNALVSGNVISDSAFVTNILSGNTLLIDQIMERNLNGNVTVINRMILENDLVVQGNITTQNIAVQSNIVVNGSIDVSTDSILNGNVVIGKNLRVEGNVEFVDCLTIDCITATGNITTQQTINSNECNVTVGYKVQNTQVISSQQPSITTLTDNSGGTESGNNTIEAITDLNTPGSADFIPVGNVIATLAGQIERILITMRNHGLIVN